MNNKVFLTGHENLYKTQFLADGYTLEQQLDGL